jgi:TetR/AcrR family fatty acid metabolism transcriptional regulator
VAAERSKDKRERILEAALRVFAERGFYNAKVSEVAREAGVADGTIYLYCANKDDLLIQLFEDRMDFIIQRLRGELEKADHSPLDQLRRLIRLHIDLAIFDPDLAEFITVELRQSSKFVKEYENPQFVEYLRILRDMIEEGQRVGEIRAGMDSRLIVRAIFGALDEVLLTLTLASRTRSVDVKMAADQLADLIIDGMAAPAEERKVSAL